MGDINGDVSTLPHEEAKVDDDRASSTEAKQAAEAQSTDHDEPDLMADDLPSPLREALSASQEEDEHSEVAKGNIVRFLKETFRQRNVRIKDHVPNILAFISAAKPFPAREGP